MKVRTALRMAQTHIIRTFIDSQYCRAAEVEKQFREEMEVLLADVTIVKVSKYTESCTIFAGKERLLSPPTDYLVLYKGDVIAAVEVTTGSKGYSYKTSKKIHIDDEKLQRMDQYNEGYVVLKVLVDEPHFVWACRDDIRSFPADEKGTHITDIKIWKPGLEGLAEEFRKLIRSAQ